MGGNKIPLTKLENLPIIVSMRRHFKTSVFSFLVMFVSVQISMSVMAATFQAGNTQGQHVQHLSMPMVSDDNTKVSQHTGMTMHAACHQGENHCADNASDNCASGSCVLILNTAEHNHSNFGPELRSILLTSLQGVVISLEIRPPRNLV